ncbi:DUF3954 domain-containing protein [Priestia taiwanensis]|uniref:DUF3954 domain-containing protein n=1 Tax=Priestia taiwanensis TaxID=1347902 RepID=A0A917EMW5_9BACI|nr:DUF3954 domain-containing protein [Priestia taiwanensis]MBM7361974.1 hypothetical protein [Priestia taiwanensis]GGE58449.1 hypothetical protein GCM10007140_06000 [Priestia taiwanensis]
MNQIKVDIMKMTAEIDVSENRIFIVKDGNVEMVEQPSTGFGEHTAVWQNGKVIRIDERSSRKI